MSEHDKPDQIAKNPDQVVGRTFADLFVHSQTGPKLDAALARLAGWSIERIEVGAERVRNLFRRVDQMLEESGIDEPKAIPERVGIEVIENVAREDREGLFELWARLMVGAAHGEEIDAYHIDLVRKLDPSSARVLLAISDKNGLVRMGKSLNQSLQTYTATVSELCDLTILQTELAFARLLALGLISKATKLETHKMAYDLSGFGAQLVKVLYPAGPYPDGNLSEFLAHSEQTSEPYSG